MIDREQLSQNALALGATNAKVVEVSKLVISDEFRKLCERNDCRRYNTNWMCPPAFGDMDQARLRIAQYQEGLVIQRIHELEDSYDFEGMETGHKLFDEVFRQLAREMKNMGFSDMLPLGAGGCSRCKKCTYPDAPCRFPEDAMASVEGYGINVMQLMKAADFPYGFSAGKVYYTGMLLYKDTNA